MAKNVFGIIIDDEIMRSLVEFSDDNKPITQADRAKEALRSKNSQEKATDVTRYVDNLKAQYDGNRSTRVVFYNATGETVLLREFMPSRHALACLASLTVPWAGPAKR